MCSFCSNQGPLQLCSFCLKDSKCSVCLKCSCEEFKCKLHKCCNSCTFCVFERATTKERCKSQCRFRKWPNKACERCFFHKTISFCPSCDKCPEGFKSKSSIYPEGGVQPPIQSQTSSHQNPSDKERICQSPQGQLPAGGIAFPPSKTSGRKSKGSVLSGILQQALHCSQTKSKVASNLRSQCPQPVPQGQNLQNGDPRVHSPISVTRGVGHVARFQRRVLSHPYQSKFKEVPQIQFSESNLPIQGSSIRPLYSSNGVYNYSKGGQTHGSGKKHPDAPIPGRLVDPGKRQRHMFSGHPNPPGVVSGVGLGREPQKIGTETQADFQFCRLPVQFGAGSSQAYPRKVGSSQLQDQFPAREDQLLGSRTHVLDRPSPRDRKAGDIESSPYEANTVAPEEPLAHPGVLREGHPDSKIPSPPPTVVVKGGKRSVRPAFAPPSSRGSDVYRCIKRRLGRTFRRLYRKRRLVCAGKQASHQFSGIESGIVGPKSFRTPLPGSGSPGCYRQYYRGSLH